MVKRETVVILAVAGAVLVIILAVFAHVASNEAARSHPPLTCELFGGSWNIWDGWRCG